MRAIKGVAAGLLALLLAGCAADSGYYWANYTETAYQYKQQPTEQNKQRFKNSLLLVLERSAAQQKKVPPGIYAELAFLELVDKNRSQAASYLKQEQRLYPESTTVTQAWLNRIEGTTP